MIIKRTNQKFRRRALIIQNPGKPPREPYAGGVLVDAKNVKAFLKSNEGGAWEEDEIEVLDIDTNTQQIKDYFAVQAGTQDYQFILFAGHGYYSENHGPMYCLWNGEEFNHAWLEELVRDVPTLLIADSCQDVLKLNEGGTIASTRLFSSITDSNRRLLYRAAYDEKLAQLPKGMFVTAASTTIGETANDNSIKGGLYTRSLLEACKDVLTDLNADKGVYGIGYINFLASQKVEKASDNKQHPELYGYTRSHQPPFLVKL